MAVKTAAKKKTAPKRKAVAKRKIAPRKAAPRSDGRTYGPRADLGAPVAGFFARQPPGLREILEALRAEVRKAAPDAKAVLKWGMPFYAVGGETMCALAAFKAHVNLILAGGEGTYADPEGLLEGEGKTGRHLKVRALAELPRAAVRGWLRTAAARARRGPP